MAWFKKVLHFPFDFEKHALISLWLDFLSLKVQLLSLLLFMYLSHVLVKKSIFKNVSMKPVEHFTLRQKSVGFCIPECETPQQ